MSEKLQKDVPSYRLITVATLVDRLKINGSLARQALNDLEEKGQIKKVVGHSKLAIYSMSIRGRLPDHTVCTGRVTANIAQPEPLQPQSKPDEIIHSLPGCLHASMVGHGVGRVHM